MWRYFKTGTYPHRFSHPEPAVAPATDTDIGPLLSAPRSHTGSWPYHKCERLMGKRETRHTLTHTGATGEYKGRRVYAILTYTFFSSHQHTHARFFFLQPIYNSQATRLPFLILAWPWGAASSTALTLPLLDFSAVQLPCAHTLAPAIFPLPTFILCYTQRLIIHLPPSISKQQREAWVLLRRAGQIKNFQK